MKELYTKPELELKEYEVVDVLTASNGGVSNDDEGWDFG